MTPRDPLSAESRQTRLSAPWPWGMAVCILAVLSIVMGGCGGSQRHVYPMLTQYEGEHLGPEATIRYVVDPEERARLRLRVKDGLLVDLTGRPLDPYLASNPQRIGFAIYVMDQGGDIYVSFDHQQDRFHHSSILAGAPVSAAGDMTILKGQILAINNSSGHYRPRAECIDRVLARLRSMGVPVDGIRISRIGPYGERQDDVGPLIQSP